MRYNKILLAGNLTRDPELRYTPSGTAVASADLAVDFGFGDSAGTAFVKLTIWGKRGEAFATHLYKGDPVFVEGELRQEFWEDKKTQAKRSKYLVNVQEWKFLKPKETAAAPAQDGETMFDGDDDDDSPF